MPLDHISLIFRVIKKNRFLILKKPIKKLNCSILFLFTIEVRNNFECDLTQVGGSNVNCLLQYFSS